MNTRSAAPVRFEQTKAQEGFLTSSARTAKYVGGLGSGKSFILTLWALFRAMNGRIVLYLLPTYNMIEDIALPTLQDHIETLGLQDKVKIVLKPPSASIGSGKILFRSGEVGNRLRGINAHDLCVDEAAYITEDTYKVAIGRVRKEENGQIRLVGTPAGAANWYSNIEAETFVQSTMANPFIPDSYKRDLLANYDGDFARQELYGEIVDFSGATQFIPMDVIRAAQSRIPYETDEPVIGGLDVARFGNDRSALVIRKGNQIIETEIWEGLDLTHLARKSKELAIRHSVETLVVDAVGVGAGVHDMLKQGMGTQCKVVEFNGAFKSDLEGYANQRAAVWGKMRTWLKDSGSIPKAELFTNDMASVEYFFNPKGKILLESKEQMKRSGRKSPDIGDALSMTFFKAATSGKSTKRIAAKLYGGPSEGWQG